MRKLLFILMLVISFALGSLSEGVIAMGSLPDGWVTPQHATAAPTLRGSFSVGDYPGVALYVIPSEWKLLSVSKSTNGHIWAKYIKQE